MIRFQNARKSYQKLKEDQNRCLKVSSGFCLQERFQASSKFEILVLNGLHDPTFPNLLRN